MCYYIMKWKNDFWLEPPFNMLISGTTECGKTHYVLDLLETHYKNKFDYIVIFCPTFLKNTTYDRKFIHDKNVLIIDMNLADLDELLERTIDFFSIHKLQTLFIIDDCANLHESKVKESAICKLAFHGRHDNITTWIITQKYNAIVKDFRDTIRMLILFFDKDKDSMESALKQNNIIPKEEYTEIYNTLKNSKGAKIILRLEHPFKYIID
jgi:A32 protein